MLLVHSACKIFQNIFLYKRRHVLQCLHFFLWCTSMIYCSLLSFIVNHCLLLEIYSIWIPLCHTPFFSSPTLGKPPQHPLLEFLPLKDILGLSLLSFPFFYLSPTFNCSFSPVNPLRSLMTIPSTYCQIILYPPSLTGLEL